MLLQLPKAYTETLRQTCMEKQVATSALYIHIKGEQIYTIYSKLRCLQASTELGIGFYAVLLFCVTLKLESNS